MKIKKTLLLAFVVVLVTCCVACSPTSTVPASQMESQAPIEETLLENSDLRQIDSTCWYSVVLGATLDFPAEWEGLFTLETTDIEVIMRMVPPTDYGGLLCFFRRESQSDWAGAKGNTPTWIELVAESVDSVIIMTRPGDEQAAPEYREQYYEIADRLSDIVVAFDEDVS